MPRRHTVRPVFLKAVSFLSALLVSSAVLAGVAWIAPEALFAYVVLAGAALVWLATSSQAGGAGHARPAAAERTLTTGEQPPRAFARGLSVIK